MAWTDAEGITRPVSDAYRGTALAMPNILAGRLIGMSDAITSGLKQPATPARRRLLSGIRCGS